MSDSGFSFVKIESENVPMREIIENPIKVPQNVVIEECSPVRDGVPASPVPPAQVRQSSPKDGASFPDERMPPIPGAAESPMVSMNRSVSLSSGEEMNGIQFKRLPEMHFSSGDIRPEDCISYFQYFFVEYNKFKSELELINCKIMQNGFQSLDEVFVHIESERKSKVALTSQLEIAGRTSDELERCRSELVKKETELNELKNQLYIVERSIQGLQTLLNDREERAKLHCRIKDLEGQINLLNDEVGEKDKMREALDAAVSDGQDKLRAAELENQHLQTSLQQFQQRCKVQQVLKLQNSTLESMNKQFEEQAALLSSTQAELQRTTKELHSVRLEHAEQMEEMKSIRDAHAVQKAELASLREHYDVVNVEQSCGDVERLQGEIAAQNFQIQVMQDDFLMQKKELDVARTELTEYTQLRVYGAFITRAPSVWKKDSDFGPQQLNVHRRYYCSETLKGPVLVDFAIPEQVQLTKIQFVSAHPPTHLEVQTKEGKTLQMVQLNYSKSCMYEIQLDPYTDTPPIDEFRWIVHKTSSGYFTLSQVLIFGF